MPTAVTAVPIASVLDARSVHIIRRFTGGWNPGLGAEVSRAGGIDRWFARQLTPSLISDTFYTGSADWWRANTATPTELRSRADRGIEPIWEAVANYERWSLVRRIHSARQVQETMAAFWEHHFHVPVDADGVGSFRPSYGRMIRRLALGRFDALLQAATTHPAMGIHLNNAVSTKTAPNENLGRELLELHTVGRSSGYTEDDVKSSARILTGYRVDLWNTWKVWYDTDAHWTGPVEVLGFRSANGSPDGRPVVAAYLRYLAHHPATAHRIARKLAVHFVRDNPSTTLVNHLASVYLANGTAIAPVLKALVASSEFRNSVGLKVRTPEEDLIATYRALGVRVLAPTVDAAAANALLWQVDKIGGRPFGWPRPDGRPDVAGAWTSVSRMLNSFNFHRTMAGGWYPDEDVRFRSPASWLPGKSVRFDRLVDHVSRKVLGRPSTAVLLQAARQATGCSDGTVITATHPLIRYGIARLLTVFLDSPTHFRR